MDYQALRITDADDARAQRDKRHTLAGLLRLRAGLDAHFAQAGVNSEGEADPRGRTASERQRGIRLATWNLREFATQNKYGARLDAAYWFIAEVISR